MEQEGENSQKVINSEQTEEKTKINDKGFIPIPKLVRWKEQLVYYREVREKDIFRKYQGIGLSVSSLGMMDKTKNYLIKLLVDSYETYYLTSVESFRMSAISYDNNGDEQKIVPFDAMELIHSNRPEQEIRIKKTKYVMTQKRLEW